MTNLDIILALDEERKPDPDTVKRSPAVEYGADLSKLRGQYADSYQCYDRFMRDLYGGSDQ
jgi:hypothetical protein